MGETALTQAEQVVFKTFNNCAPPCAGFSLLWCLIHLNAVKTVNENRIHDFHRWAEECRVSRDFMQSILGKE